MTHAERDKLILDYETTHTRWIKGIKDGSLNSHESDELKREVKRIKTAYFAGLPRMTLSRCPFTSTPLVKAFDPWGVDGYWWQEDEAAAFEEPPAPPNFAVLTGAVNLNGRPPKGGPRKPAHVGPDAPFVIPRVLELPTMVAVVSGFTMANGYRAFPVAYFSKERPAPGTLTQSWTRTSYNWRDAKGNPAFSYPTHPWDFDLRPWIDRGKVMWTVPDDKDLKLQKDAASCPYLNLQGSHQRQIILGNTLRTEPPPQGEEINPFGD
jgi:hypothetical protein